MSSTQIHFCCLIYDETILMSHQTKSENFVDVITSVGPLVPAVDGEKKITFTSELFQVHILADGNGLMYCCISDTTCSILVSFTFLDIVRKKFIKENCKNNEFLQVPSTNIENKFLPILVALMIDFNEGRGDKLSFIDSQIRDVKEILLKNVDLLVERGEKLEDILAKSENLTHSSRDFRQASLKVSRRQKCKNWKMWIFITLILAIILTTAALIATGIIKLG